MVTTNRNVIFFSRFIGLVGMACLIGGNFFPISTTRAACFTAGCLLLLVPPLIELNPFFITLQIVALSGAVMFFFDIPLWLKAFIPLTVATISAIIFYRKGLLREPLTIFGFCGVVLLAFGYGVTHALYYFLGGLILAIYSFINFKQGVRIAIMWAITNVMFCLAAFYAILLDWGIL